MEQAENRVEDPTEAPDIAPVERDSEAWYKHWRKELDAEDKRNRNWREKGDRVQQRYLDLRDNAGNIDRQYEFKVNLFHSNVFTLKAFMYGRIPKVDVSRRFADTNDDVGRVAANILNRVINTSIQDTENEASFTSVMRSILEDYLVPGLGVPRIRYEYTEEEVQIPAQVMQAPSGPVEISPPRAEKQVTWEDAPIDYIHWRDFRWGYGRVWEKLPWIGYDVYLTKKEATARFSPEVASKLTYRHKPVTDPQNESENPDIQDPSKTAKITEIWSKKHNKVFWFHKDYQQICDIKDDPLQLDGFFPSPSPMIANSSTTLFIPQPFFYISQDLYNEVDQLSTRINIITNAVKVVGVYDKTFKGELSNMLQQSVENDMIAVDNYAMLGEKGGLKGVIDFWPVDQVVETLDKLREMRREAIELLYQVTGMSDIMRGASDQYTGVGTQKLKASMGSVRVQYMQEEFARLGSDILSLKAEVVCKHFQPQTIMQQANITKSYDAQLAPQAIELLKNPQQAQWRVEIKAESMAMIDWTQLKMDRTEFLNALATFMQSAAPLLEQNPASAPVLMEMLKWGLAGFKGGQEIESVLDKAIEDMQKQPPQQKQDEGAGKAQAEVAKIRAGSQAKMAENQQKFMQDMQKQAQKASDDMKKMLAQWQTDMAELKASLQADIIRERVQADEGIRQERAKPKPQPRTQ